MKNQIKLFLLFLAIGVNPISALGAPIDQNSPNNNTIKDPSADVFDENKQIEVKGFIEKFFAKNLISEESMNAAISLSAPFTNLIMIFTLALVAIICYGFFGQTATDLMYITVPMTRSFFERAKEGREMEGHNRNNKGGIRLFVISDAAQEATEKASQQGDRTVSGGILAYAKLRSVEFVAFILFVVFLFSGVLGELVYLIFLMFVNIFQGLFQLASAPGTPTS